MGDEVGDIGGRSIGSERIVGLLWRVAHEGGTNVLVPHDGNIARYANTWPIRQDDRAAFNGAMYDEELDNITR